MFVIYILCDDLYYRFDIKYFKKESDVIITSKSVI